MKPAHILLLAAIVLSGTVAHAASTITISIDSRSAILTDNLGIALTGGTSTDGDGAVLQLGYFDGASANNNFVGNWVPLTGQGSLNIGGVIPGTNSAEPYNKTSIGDTTSAGAGNGTFALELIFTVGDAGTGNSLPNSTSIPLAIRFYNGVTISGSTLFNTVSDNAWLWQTPAASPSSPLVGLSLSDPGLVWQGGASSADKTTIANVPEPGSAALALIGGTAMLIRRRRMV